MNRREFIKVVGLGAAGVSSVGLNSCNVNAQKKNSPPIMGMHSCTPLKVKPALVYRLYKRQEARTWREWGGLRTQSDVDMEVKRIENELKTLVSVADFPMEVLPVTRVNTDSKAAQVKDANCDVILIYAAGAGGAGIYRQEFLDTLCSTEKSVLMFLRHKSGPIYLWYEIVHPTFLRKRTDDYKLPNIDVWDIVVDDYSQVLWRLRALYGLKNTLGTRIVAVGGIGGWGAGGRLAPANAKETWKLDIKTVDTQQIKLRMDKKLNNIKTVQKARRQMDKYLSQRTILSVHTDRKFILNAFLLRDIFIELMEQADAPAITVNNCMNIGPIAKTTVCLPWSLINDEGLMAFCESDFVVIPAGILLRYISGKPVFLNDPTFPHDGITTCAHCTAPRRMHGKDFEPTKILTHCESDYGAAPKVQFRKGQMITNVIPDFACKKWVGFRGKIIDHPSYNICRSQFDCTIEGDWRKLLEDMQGFHWMTCYGDYLHEVGYALKKVGIEWENITEGAT